ncbi:MAG: LysM peptidoglycan-binding domain-containing protein [Acidobacteriia bacterium]|nr:LysM peptidoglycan-binding domain-containing protein [Terriglobia bacterium]
MKRLLPVHAFAGLCAFFAPALVLCQPQSVILGAATSLADGKNASNIAAQLPDDPDIPPKMLDLMRSCETRYLDGSSLIKAGDSAKARLAFDEAVDLLLRSEWEITSTPVLNRYFQDLIQRIQRDESRYLRPEEDTGEKPERAVVDELEKLDLIPIQVDPSLKDAVDADILNTKYDIPIRVNESVYKALNFWVSHGRKFFIDGMTRSGRYQEMIERVFREESVPRDLMYLAQVESLFMPNALSRALARGIWQFTKGTATRYGLKVNKYIDERSDPEKSTRAAARYLNDLYAMFNDWNLVLAAYNWGEGAVQRLVDRSGLSDFWQLADLKRKMPAETKNHVPLIMASIILARNPEKYGLPIEMDPPLRYDQVQIPKRVNLKAVAKALDVQVDVLTRLNPALKSYNTPPDNPDFVLNVPLGMGESFSEKLAALSSGDLKVDPEFSGRHRVKPGETLTAIASQYGVSVDELQVANNIASPKLLRAGAWLLVPTTSAAARSAGRPARSAAFSGSYQVQPGETLSEIAKRYSVPVASLEKANGIKSAESLRAGALLKVPSTPAVSESASKAGEDRRHVVKPGETLSSIAAIYGITVAALQKANGIRSPKSLQVGAMLQIPPPATQRASISKKG